MGFKKFYSNYEAKIFKRIEQITYLKQSLFATLCCERALPNYIHYARLEKFGNPDLLYKSISYSYNVILYQSDIDTGFIAELMLQLESIENIPDSSTSMFSNYAQDAIIVIYDLLKFLQTKDVQLLVQIGSTCIETTQKYIFENYGYTNDQDEEYEKKMLSFSTISKEYSLQINQLDEIINAELLTPSVIDNLRNQNNFPISNIGLF